MPKGIANRKKIPTAMINPIRIELPPAKILKAALNMLTEKNPSANPILRTDNFICNALTKSLKN